MVVGEGTSNTVLLPLNVLENFTVHLIKRLTFKVDGYLKHLSLMQLLFTKTIILALTF